MPSLRIAAASLLLSLAALPAAAQNAGNRHIVVFHDGVDAAASAADLIRAHGGSADHVYKHALKGFAGNVGNPNAVAGDPRVKYVVPDRVLSLPRPIADGKPGGGTTPPPAQSVPTGIRRVKANLSATAKIDGADERVNVDVAVIDTGIELAHPELNVAGNVSFVSGASTGNDDNGHGTHVAGTIGAIDNGVGVVGVAPGARLWAVKVLNKQGSGWTSQIAAGIDWVTARAATIEVANMSLGGSGSDTNTNDPMHDAIRGAVNAGVVFVVAAGNENVDAATKVPAAYDEVITVSALADSDGAGGGLGAATSYGPDDTLATFSNFGADVDVAAPGVGINSTYKGKTYKVLNGTSMASPHVAGIVALYLAANAKPTTALGVEAVKQTILNVAFPQFGPDGFTADRDAYAEPVGNASPF
jgi:subtilisin family serine protease